MDYNDHKIALETVVMRKQNIPTVDLDGEIGMMHMDQEKYYGLNTVGSRIWELMHGPISIERMISLLCTEFEVDPELCREQVITFLHKLYCEDLVQFV